MPMYFCAAQPGNPSTPTHDLTANVEVEGFAMLEVVPDQLSLGRAQPGEPTDPVSLGITCMTNLNEPWSLTLYTKNPFYKQPEEDHQIPHSNFNWQLIDSGGELVTEGTMPSEPLVMYTAGMEEYITETPVELALLFSVDIPQGQAKGVYQTTITVSMQPEAIQP